VKQAKEDYVRLAAIATNLIEALQNGEAPKVKLLLYSFSRQASDSLSMQPLEFRPLAQAVEEIKKQVI
jgi:hypothetical protein